MKFGAENQSLNDHFSLSFSPGRRRKNVREERSEEVRLSVFIIGKFLLFAFVFCLVLFNFLCPRTLIIFLIPYPTFILLSFDFISIHSSMVVTTFLTFTPLFLCFFSLPLFLLPALSKIPSSKTHHHISGILRNSYESIGMDRCHHRLHTWRRVIQTFAVMCQQVAQLSNTCTN